MSHYLTVGRVSQASCRESTLLLVGKVYGPCPTLCDGMYLCTVVKHDQTLQHVYGNTYDACLFEAQQVAKKEKNTNIRVKFNLTHQSEQDTMVLL